MMPVAASLRSPVTMGALPRRQQSYGFVVHPRFQAATLNAQVKTLPFNVTPEKLPKNAQIASGSAFPELAERVVKCLDNPLAPFVLKTFADGSLYARAGSTVRGKQVFVIQPTSGTPGGPSTNDNLIQAGLMADALRRSEAGKITLIAPFYGNSRSDRQVLDREAVAAKVATDFLAGAGVNHTVTFDIHNKAIASFTNNPFDNFNGLLMLSQYVKENYADKALLPADSSKSPTGVAPSGAVGESAPLNNDVVAPKAEADLPRSEAKPSFIQRMWQSVVDCLSSCWRWIQEQLGWSVPSATVDSVKPSSSSAPLADVPPGAGTPGLVVISPDEGGVKRAKDFGNLLSPDAYLGNMNKVRDKVTGEIIKMEFLGRPELVQGKTVILPDDMIDTAGTMCKAADELMRLGAKEVIAVATHGFFNKDAVENINKSRISRVIVSNTMPLSEKAKSCDKLVQVDIAPMIAEAIKRMTLSRSLSDLKQ